MKTLSSVSLKNLPTAPGFNPSVEASTLTRQQKKEQRQQHLLEVARKLLPLLEKTILSQISQAVQTTEAGGNSGQLVIDLSDPKVAKLGNYPQYTSLPEFARFKAALLKKGYQLESGESNDAEVEAHPTLTVKWPTQ